MSTLLLTRPVRVAALVVSLVAGVTVAMSSSAFAAPPSNDDIGGATPLSVPTTIVQDTTEATTSADETALNGFCGAPALAQGVWFTATAAQSGNVAVDVTASDHSAGTSSPRARPERSSRCCADRAS